MLTDMDFYMEKLLAFLEVCNVGVSLLRRLTNEWKATVKVNSKSVSI
jgi:hypothetical protein